MAMEALTYDRALAYKEEFPPSEYETWQPRKVMLVLLEIDPMADKDSFLAFGLEEQCGVLAPKMNSLGSEKVLNTDMLRKHYDALGSYLHMQSMKHIREGRVLDFNKIRDRCSEIAAFINQVLCSPIFNITLGKFATLNCFECKQPIRKRITSSQSEILAKCFQCKATYVITDEGNGKVKWMPQQQEVKCANDDCHQTIIIWHHEIEVGRHWKCNQCNGVNHFALHVTYKKNA